ncbi:DUF4198 domain-containing protein [Histidinibacterium aquaticum]|uniref:DUF4198 domain-containing protein n=1 Tax=Histidinibacterium aquaticum TaxID=2613962 RepID=A0A5J5GNJ8_9RHOB|nr:DUF4198 domain-containing protein [Histidinibacterium aquaticum]KAA9009148.1 DUF4198 domain-containing protein [Histidinibacterium aquaticum]
MRFFALCLGLLAAPASAHEYWIEPLDYAVEADGMLRGHLVNGQQFEGTRFAYIPQRFARFAVFAGDRSAPVEGRIGDRPALDIAPLAEGLNVVAYVSDLNVVRYDAVEDFLSFAEHKDLGEVEERARAEAEPDGGIGEAYTRYAKTLIAVGDGAGTDRRTGLETEIVALENPYTAEAEDGLDVQVFYGDALRADAQVELFEKAEDGTVEVTLHRTNAEGIATLPVRPGHSYLVDAVVLRQPAADLAEGRNVVWETLWASLTFAVPE